jgi:hypothetical protein
MPEPLSEPPWKVTRVEAVGIDGYVEVRLIRERVNPLVTATETMALVYPIDKAPRVYDEIPTTLSTFKDGGIVPDPTQPEV